MLNILRLSFVLSYILRCLTLKSVFFIERDTDVKRFSISPRSDVPAFSGSMPWRKVLNSAAPAVCVCVCVRERERERERKRQSVCIFLYLCACVGVCVLSHSLSFSVWNATPADVSCKLQPPASLPFRGDHWNKAIKVALYMGRRSGAWVYLPVRVSVWVIFPLF